MQNKKLFLALFLGIFLILTLSFASATIKDYNLETKTVTLHHNFLFFKTSKIGTITLLSPLKNNVGLGYVPVAEMEVSGFENYGDFISQMQSYNLRNGYKEISKKYDFKIKETKEVLVDDYHSVVVGYTENGTTITEYKKTGTHLENQSNYRNLKPKDLNGKNITVEIWTTVKPNDYVEWIPTISGKRITEWASYVASVYDLAKVDNVATNFNSTDTLYSFNAGQYYYGLASSTAYYSLFQKTNLGINGFNMSTYLKQISGTGQDLQIGFGDKQVTSSGSEVPMACGVGNQPPVVNNGYLIGINRGRTQYGLYKVVSGAVTLLGSCKAIADPGDGSFFPVNLTYDGSTVEVYVNGVKETISDSSYTLTSSTGFGQTIYKGGASGGQGAVKDMYVFTSGSTAPTYSNEQTNSTNAGETTLFSILADDGDVLNPNGQYIFSTNNSGTWVNDSEINFTSTPEWANVSKVLNSTVNKLIGFRWYISNNNSVLAQTPIYTITTTDGEDPVTNLYRPLNGSISSNLTQNFIANESDNYELSTANLHIWDSSGSEVVNTFNSSLNGNMWIADYNGGGHGYTTKVLPNGTSFAYSLAGTFNYPHWIAMDNNSNMWIIGFSTAGVEKVLPNGTSFLYTTNSIANGRYIVFNPYDGYMYGCGNGVEVEKISPSGVINSTGVLTLTGSGCNAISVQEGGDIWFFSGVGSTSVADILLSNGTGIHVAGQFGSKAPNEASTNGTDIVVGGGQAGNNQFSIWNVASRTVKNVSVSFTQPVNTFYDGEGSFWLASQDNATAIRYWTNNGTINYYPGLGLTPYGSAYNPSQRSMWFSSRDSNIATRLYIDNGTMINYTLSGSYDPHGMAFDGAYLTPVNPPYGLNGSSGTTKNISGTSNSTSWLIDLPSPDVYQWNVKTCDSSGNCAWANENYTLSIFTAPTITLNSPENNYNSSSNSITFNSTISEEVPTNVSLYLDGVLSETNSSGFLGDYLFTSSLLDGDHNWSIESCNIYGCGISSTRDFNIDTSEPEINITSPSGTYDYLYQDYNLTLNFTSTDSHLDSCKWNYNGTNQSIICTSGVPSIAYLNYSQDKNNITVYANDSYGNSKKEVQTWDYKVLEINKTFNNQTTEGTFETFNLYLKKGSGVNVQNVVLHYENETDTSSLFSSGSNVRAESELFIPDVSLDTNNTFYFTVTLGDGTVFNTTNETQLVENINLDDCSSQPNKFLTLNLVDEENQSAINGDIEVYLSIINPVNFEQVLSLNNSYSGVSTKSFCSDVLLNESSFLLGAEIRYSANNHSAEFYNIQRSNLSSYPKNYTLYDLKSDDTTRFKLIYRGENLIGVEGAIVQLQRKYISEGVYKIVEAPLTSEESTAVVHIDTNTNKYKVTVVKNGEVLNTFDNLVFICQSELTGDCTLDLQDYVVPPNSIPIETLQDFSYSISSDIDNKTISVDYSVPSGTTSTIRVLATQTDIVGESTICNTTVSSAGGAIECGYNNSIQDSYIHYNLYKDGEPIAQKSYIVKDDLREDFGGDNYFILIIFTISLIFMALLSPEWIVLNAIIAIIVGGATWLIRGMDFVLGLGAIAWLLLGAIIIIIKLAQKEDQ